MSLLRSSPAYLVIISGLVACGTERPREQLYGADSGLEDREEDDEDGGDARPWSDIRDLGIRDRDVGRELPGRPDRCPNRTEGCECTSTSTAPSIPFRQEDCDVGLLCVEWDLSSGLVRGQQLEGPVKSCVKPCSVDSDCGANRFCRSLGFIEETGAGKICVDAVAEYDEACSGSRMSVEQITNPATMDMEDRIVACEEGLNCQLFQFGDAFNPDESMCLAFCEVDADCVHPRLPYCNPRFFTSTSTIDPHYGVCSEKKSPNGALCGSSDPDKIFRVSTACDTSEETCGPNTGSCPVCVGINLDQNRSLTPEGMGICMSPCNNMNPCAGGRTCTPQFFSNGDGVCSDGCRAVPETCPGAGSVNAGQSCLELAGNASFCVDSYPPPLSPSRWDSAGTLRENGDDCTGDLGNFSFFRCPDGSTCTPTDTQGYCIYGCTPDDMAEGDALCQSLFGSMTAVCTEPQMGFGVCGDN